ncbi:MAG: hypothetical protein H6598_06385 [Flavobacteriales bacterium]|nr:hypothetical protein [Flavobacteriales bacterium]
MKTEPIRVLFVNKSESLINQAKLLYDEEAKNAPLELICYESLKLMENGFYINYDLAFIDLAEIVDSHFIEMNKEHYNWNNLKVVLLVNKFTAEYLTKLYDLLEKNELKLEIDYITTDSYSDRLICVACSQYCREMLNTKQ